MRTKALCMVSPGQAEARDRDLPEMSDYDLLVRIRVCGVCRGDVEAFRGDESVPLPYFGGHEGAGTVDAVGSAVTRFKPGDNVALLGDGRFSQLSIAAEHQAALLPADIQDWSQWVVEPLACCVNGVDVADVRPDDVVGVIGCGFMGQGVLRALALTPARQLIGMDVRDDRLATAVESGATHTLRSDADIAAVYAAVDELVVRRPMPNSYVLPGLENGPLDIAFETSGTKPGLALAASLLRVGGTLVMFGHQRGPVTIDGTQWHLKGLRVLNASPMIAEDFHQIFYRTAALMQSGRLNLSGLITHRSDLGGEVLAQSTEPDYIKGVVLI